MIELLRHRVRGVVPPYNRYLMDNILSYDLALGVSTPRGLERLCAAYATDVAQAERGCRRFVLRFASL